MNAVITALAVISHRGEETEDGFWRNLSEPIPDAASRAVRLPSNGTSRAGDLLARCVARVGAAGDAAPARRGSILSVSKLGIDALLAGRSPMAFLDPTAVARRAARAEGPALTPIAACATGLAGILRGLRLLEAGEADEVVVGVGEASLPPLLLAGFDRLGVVTHTRPRPFDNARDGFVPAEGAAAFLIEREDRARARGSVVRARIRGGGARSAAQLLRFDARGEEISSLARAALSDARTAPEEIGWIHAHATGTRAGDASEAAALGATGFCDTPVASTKGATGHALGAAGGLAAAAAILGLERGMAPPTAGLEATDLPICASPHAIPTAAPCVLVLGYGFGGQTAAVVFERA